MDTSKSRRNFIKKASIGTAVVAGAGTAAVAGYRSGVFSFIKNSKTQPPSDKLNLAYVGIGGRAKQNILATKDLGVNVVALCAIAAEVVLARVLLAVERRDRGHG